MSVSNLFIKLMINCSNRIKLTKKYKLNLKHLYNQANLQSPTKLPFQFKVTNSIAILILYRYLLKKMIPQQMKKLFGLTNQKDLGMANNIWKMLDEMAQNSPQKYKQFIQKNIKQGVQQVKHKKEQKDKPFKIKPQKGFLLQFDVILNEKYLPQNQTPNLNQQLQQKLSLNTQNWEQVKKKFSPKVHIFLSVCHSSRVKLPIDKNKKSIENLTLQKVKQIDIFYYSLQGPHQAQNSKNVTTQLSYVMILPTSLYQSLLKSGAHGKKMLMSLSISYFQQRLQTDRNPLLHLYNPEQFRKLVFYCVEKLTIQLNQQKNYYYGNSQIVEDFLLQRQIDIKREKQLQDEQLKAKEKLKIQEKKHEIVFKPQQAKQELISKTHENKPQNNLTQIQHLNQNSTSTKQKRPFIQVLNQTQLTENIPDKWPYELRQTEQGYHIEILIPGISSISELDLEISDLKVMLKKLSDTQNLLIQFNNPVNSDLVKAKLKKKVSKLIIEAPFLHKK